MNFCHLNKLNLNSWIQRIPPIYYFLIGLRLALSILFFLFCLWGTPIALTLLAWGLTKLLTHMQFTISNGVIYAIFTILAIFGLGTLIECLNKDGKNLKKPVLFGLLPCSLFTFLLCIVCANMGWHGFFFFLITSVTASAIAFIMNVTLLEWYPKTVKKMRLLSLDDNDTEGLFMVLTLITCMGIIPVSLYNYVGIFSMIDKLF